MQFVSLKKRLRNEKNSHVITNSRTLSMHPFTHVITNSRTLSMHPFTHA